MLVEVRMPQLSDTIYEGRILVWRKKEGESVEKGDTLLEVVIDKTVLDIQSFNVGTLLKIVAKEGSVVNIGSVIAYLDKTDNVYDSTETTASSGAHLENKQANIGRVQNHVAKEFVNMQDTNISFEVRAPGDKVKISPLAKNIAQQHNIQYGSLMGSGDDGKILRCDVEQAIAQSPQKVFAKASHINSASTQTNSGIPETIANPMLQSAQTIPHFFVTASVKVSALLEVKESLVSLAVYEGITINHFIIKAAALALKSFARINSSYVNSQILQSERINIGIVTSLQNGFLIPVIRNADVISLAQLVSEEKALVQRAKEGRINPDDLLGGTFSISNIGESFVENWTEILSPGQGAILAVASIQEEPVVCDGKVVVGQVMRITLSCDHRIIDRALAGQFISLIKKYLEEPVLILAQ